MHRNRKTAVSRTAAPAIILIALVCSRKKRVKTPPAGVDEKSNY